MGGEREQIVLNFLPGFSDKGTKGEIVGKTDFHPHPPSSHCGGPAAESSFGRCGGLGLTLQIKRSQELLRGGTSAVKPNSV